MFCHGVAPSDIHMSHLQDDCINDEQPLFASLPVSGNQDQLAAKYSCDDFCADCKSSFGHHLTDMVPFPVNSLPDLVAPEIETAMFMFLTLLGLPH